MPPRTFLLGLDGASWNVLDRLLAVGAMPNLARLCREGARATLSSVMDEPLLFRQGQVVGAYILGQIAEGEGDADAARAWHARMAEAAPKVIPALEEEARRHKQTPYGETLKEHVRAMQRIIARRPLEDRP